MDGSEIQRNNRLFLDENYYVYDHKEDRETLHIFIKSKRNRCRCPTCGMESRKLHATYERTLQDTPIRCKQTFLHVNVYKYDCLNPECDCMVFMEELPFAKASQVRTDALNTLVLGVSMFLSNEGASKVLGLLGIRIISNDTIHRLYDRIGFSDNPDVEEVGIEPVHMLPLSVRSSLAAYRWPTVSTCSKTCLNFQTRGSIHRL